MPIITLKNSAVTSAPATLTNGEVAVNVSTNNMFIGKSGAVTKIVGSLASQEPNAVNITGGTITSTTQSAGTLRTTSLRLNSGQIVTAVTNDPALGLSSNTDIPTQSAVTSYVTSKGGAIKQILTFTGNGTYTKSGPDVRKIRVICVGAGGGGRGYGESGGSGGMAELIIDATAITSVAVTIGTGGLGGQYFGFSGQGATTSFGGYLSATGGYGANQNFQHCGGHGGLGYGGNVNAHGGGGAGHKNCHTASHHNPGHGGQSFFGGSNAGHHYSERFANNIGAPGAGGAGHNFYGNGAFSAGYNGLFGICVVYEYK
jgi:hypothetical protein